MNDRNDLLRTEAMDLISRAKSMIVLLQLRSDVEKRRHCHWRLLSNTSRTRTRSLRR
jgi:hypothetical protein